MMFFYQQMPQLQQSTHQQHQLQCKHLAKLTQHLQDIDKWWSTRHCRRLHVSVRKENKQAGREVCNVTIFGEPMYFWDNKDILGSAPHCGWWLLVIEDGEWIN
jgi:hypothetical protein